MPSSIPSHLDRVLMMIGCPGRYHLLVAFLLCCMQFPVSFSGHLLTFYKVTPPHRCRAKSNLTLGDFELRPLVTTNGRRRYSSCELYVDPMDHSQGTKGCSNGWEFLIQHGEWNIVTEWELVCEREYLIALLPYTTTAAAMIGALLTGVLADRYGRKYVLLFSLLLHTSLGVALHFLPVYGLFASIFSLQGLLITSVQCTAYLLLVENLPTPWQWRAALAVAAFQCCGELLLAVLAWLVRHWRYIQLVISAPGVVVIGYFWLLPRSLAWLVMEDRQESAHVQLERLSSFSGLVFVPSLRIQLLKSCRVAQTTEGGFAARHGLETIVCSPRLRLLAFTQYYVWFVMSLVSKCPVEDIPVLRGNPYSSLFIHGVIELGFTILLFFATSRLGSKSTQGMAMSICGILCIFSAIVDHQVEQMSAKSVTERGLHLLPPVLAFLGKCLARATAICIFLHAAKTFPTGVRALGLGTCIFWGKVAHLFTPHLEDLSESSRYVVLAIGGALCVVGGMLSSWVLPDCTKRPLATIAEEIEISRVKIIDDADLDLQDTSGGQDFVPNIPVGISEDTASSTSRTSGETEDQDDSEKSILTRLATIIHRKSHRILRSSSSKERAGRENRPPPAVIESDVFEPVTGFVFKWDQADPQLRLTDFEKELSSFWKANCGRCDSEEKENNNELNNELNLFYHFQTYGVGNLEDTSL